LNNKQIQFDLQYIFEKRPVYEEEINAYLEKYQQYMNSKTILKLLNKLEKERILLNNNRLLAILEILLRSPDKLSGEDIYSLVRFSKGIRNSPLRLEIWKVILEKVLKFISAPIYICIFDIHFNISI